MIDVTEAAQLVEIFERYSGEHILVLGEGSNTVFLADYQGIVLRNKIKEIIVEESDSDYLLTVGAGVNWHSFVQWTLDESIFGLENLALIPGTVGAAPIQNIGAYGVELNKYCSAVHYFDRNDKSFNSIAAEQCQFGYRYSIFKHELKDAAIITHVEFRLSKDWLPETSYGPLHELSRPSALDIFHKVIDVRSSKLPDPAQFGNAGSFFKNPVIDKKIFERIKTEYPQAPNYPVNEQCVKIPAAWFIDVLGFKGKQVGDIQCNPKQPLVLMNLEDGKAEHLLALAKDIQHQVLTKFAVRLQPEVRFIGKYGEVGLDDV